MVSPIEESRMNTSPVSLSELRCLRLAVGSQYSVTSHPVASEREIGRLALSALGENQFLKHLMGTPLQWAIYE